jgi:uncharacterized membrane protein YjjP (DUF1212 family)
MADDTGTSVRITNLQVYNKLMEVNAVQIQMVAELRNLKELPQRLNEVEQKLARFEWIEKLAFTALGAGLAGFIAALWGLFR